VVVPTTGQTCWADIVVVVGRSVWSELSGYWVVFGGLRMVSVQGDGVCVQQRKQDGRIKETKETPQLPLRALTFYLVVSPLVVLKHHKLERPRACPANSAYNAGQRSIQSL